MGFVGFAAFQAQTRMSTIPLLPPERSHICIALASELCAQALAGSGVGFAAAALGASDALPAALGAADAPPLLGAADAPPAALGAPVDAPELQAAMTRMNTIARAGSLRWVLIRSPPTVQSSTTGRSTGARPRWASGTLSWLQSSAYIRFHTPEGDRCRT